MARREGVALSGEARRGRLTFERGAAGTVIREAFAESPLKLLMPNNHGRAAWVFAATFGGGLVDGDAIGLDVAVGPGAAGLLGTQASTKVYRCPTGACRQDLATRVGEGALLVSIPDPVVCFAGARYAQTITVDLAPGASLVLLDAFTAGRSARGERWELSRYTSRTIVSREGTPLLLDPIVLDPAEGAIPARLGRFDALATLLLFGPQVKALRDAALASPRPLGKRAKVVEAASPIGDDGAVIRLAGSAVEDVVVAARARLDGLGALLGDDPFARKW
ncbi:MAG: urease accessory protein UreD [Byssovorax sp.]